MRSVDTHSNTDAPLVYAIVLNYNGMRVSPPCLRSLLTSRYDNLRVLFVDNGSTDGSLQAVRNEFPDIEILENGANLYFAAGNNRGIEQALQHGADYVFILNNDTEVRPECVARLVEFMTATPEAGACQPLLCFMDDQDIIASAGCRIAGSGKAWDGMCGMPAEDAGEAPFPMPGVTGGAMMARADTLARVGLFDESFEMYFEDVDLSLRMRRQGFTLFCIPQARVLHEISASTDLAQKWRIGYFCERNSYRVMIKHFPFPKIIAGLFRGIPMACLASGANLIRGNVKYGIGILAAALQGVAFLFRNIASLNKNKTERAVISEHIDYDIIYPPRCTKPAK